MRSAKLNLRILISIVISIFSTHSLAENYAECLISGAKNAKTHPTVAAVLRDCLSRNPGGYSSVEAGHGNKSWLPFSTTVDQCIIKNTANVTLPQSASVISRACCCIYGDTSNQCWTAGSNKEIGWLANSNKVATCEVLY